MRSKLIAFYRGVGPNSEGYYLADILAWSFAQLETNHDYIQWLFPKRRPSRYSDTAPKLTSKEIELFKDDPVLRQAVLMSLRTMLEFYGFVLVDGRDFIRVVKAPSADERLRVWMWPGSHNFERITRILVSLRTLGLEQYSHAFLAALEDVYRSPEGQAVFGESIKYWRRAARSARCLW